MLVAKQELAIEVAKVDGIEVDNVNLAKAGKDQVLEQLAANAASSYHENTRLLHVRDSENCIGAVSVAPS